MAEDHLRRIGARIKALREARGLTQDALGDLIGVREQTISRWENGRHQAVLGNANKLADALEVDVQDITGHLPAPLGLGASEDHLASIEAKFEGLVADVLERLDDQDGAGTEVRNLLQRQSQVLAAIEGLLARQSKVLERIEILVESLPSDESTRRLTEAIAGTDLPGAQARGGRAEDDRASRAR